MYTCRIPFILLLLIVFVGMDIYMHVKYMYTTCVPGVLGGQKSMLGLELTDGCELLCGC